MNTRVEQPRPFTTHFTLEGRLDAHHAAQLRRTLLLLHNEARRVFITMSAVEFMDSSGLAAIISGLKAARQTGGEFGLIAPSESVRRVLAYTLLDRVVPIHESLEAAFADPVGM